MRTRLTALLAGLALLLATVPAAFADPPPTLQSGILTVGINMPSPGFQVGAVRGHGVVFARGFEIDLANALAVCLGVPRVVFYQKPRFDRLLAPGPKPWDIALAEVTITPERSANVLFSIPYLAADQAFLPRERRPHGAHRPGHAHDDLEALAEHGSRQARRLALRPTTPM